MPVAGVFRRSVKRTSVVVPGNRQKVRLKYLQDVGALNLTTSFGGKAQMNFLARDEARIRPGDVVVLSEPDQFACQQFQCPTGAACGGARTGGRDQQGFLFARELTAGSWARLFAERRLQVAQH